MEVYELVELETGEVVLQRADGEGEPLFKITLGEELLAKNSIDKSYIAKQMIQAGMDAAEEQLLEAKEQLGKTIELLTDPSENFESLQDRDDGQPLH